MKKKIGISLVGAMLLIALALLVTYLVLPVHARPVSGIISDKLGPYTGAGAGQGHNIKASLDLAHTDLDAIIAKHTSIERSISVDLASLASGANNLFAVTGGPIKLTEIVAYVTGTIQSQSTLIGYNVDPTNPATATVFGTDGTALEINADAVGTVYTWDGVMATDLTATTNGVVLAMGTDISYGLIIPIGMIELTSSATSTGTLTVYMTYIPLSPDTVVTAQ